jgi:hypothetical protein
MVRPSRLTARLLAAVAVVSLCSLGLSMSVASAVPGIDPCETNPDLCPPDPPPFEPPANGFTWAMAPRFGPTFNGLVDYHWNEEAPRSLRWGADIPANREKYDPAHVHPSGFDTGFYACPTADEATRSDNGVPAANTYSLVVDGVPQVARQDCNLSYRFPRQGTFSVRVDITGPNAGSFTQSVVIKDYLIASIGDSYGSGEGNPDVDGSYDIFGAHPAARWEDTRCHRSSKAGPAQAALRLENADPHSTVTFLSFACSGATINRNYNAGQPPWDPYAAGDSAKANGTGVLGPYRGVEPVNPDAYNDYVPDQIGELARTVGDRRIDALVVSGGGNDMGFGPLAASCVWASNCITDNYTVTGTGGDQVRVQTRFDQDMAAIAGRYAALAAAINNQNPVGRPPLRVARTFITQYPDSTTEKNSSGQVITCDEILEDIAWALGSKMSGQEVDYARNQVLPRMNGAVAAAASTNGWEVVGEQVGASVGHGYCVGVSDQPNSERWIRTAAEAENTQGPHDRSKTTGTLHPTARGHQAYADAILAHVSPFVAGLPVENRPPTVNAGADQTVASGAGFTLSATGADPENQPLRYQWVQLTGPAAVLRSPTSARTDVTGVTGPATLSFQVRVTDDVSQIATDTVTVQVGSPKTK